MAKSKQRERESIGISLKTITMAGGRMVKRMDLVSSSIQLATATKGSGKMT
jgi:hypothetical protein